MIRSTLRAAAAGRSAQIITALAAARNAIRRPQVKSSSEIPSGRQQPRKQPHAAKRGGGSFCWGSENHRIKRNQRDVVRNGADRVNAPLPYALVEGAGPQRPDGPRGAGSADEKEQAKHKPGSTDVHLQTPERADRPTPATIRTARRRCRRHRRTIPSSVVMPGPKAFPRARQVRV